MHYNRTEARLERDECRVKECASADHELQRIAFDSSRSEIVKLDRARPPRESLAKEPYLPIRTQESQTKCESHRETTLVLLPRLQSYSSNSGPSQVGYENNG